MKIEFFTSFFDIYKKEEKSYVDTYFNNNGYT